METTLTLPHFIPGKRGGETSMSTDTEVGLKETACNLLGCFHNEAKANYQESPAVFTGKRASVVEEAEEEMDEGAIRISGVCQSSNENKQTKKQNATVISPGISMTFGVLLLNA